MKNPIQTLKTFLFRYVIRLRNWLMADLIEEITGLKAQLTKDIEEQIEDGFHQLDIPDEEKLLQSMCDEIEEAISNLDLPDHLDDRIEALEELAEEQATQNDYKELLERIQKLEMKVFPGVEEDPRPVGEDDPMGNGSEASFQEPSCGCSESELSIAVNNLIKIARAQK